MRATIGVAALLVCLSVPAFAQDTVPAVDIGGGYSFLRDQDLEENFHGWVASVAGNLNRWMGVVGEVGGNYRTENILVDVDFSVHSFMGGVRFSARQAGGVTPFGQILLGGVRGSVSALGESESSTEFAIQPGAGSTSGSVLASASVSAVTTAGSSSARKTTARTAMSTASTRESCSG